MVSRAAAASEKFIRAGRSFPGSTVDDEGLPLLSVFQLDPKCCERLLQSPAIGELGCTDVQYRDITCIMNARILNLPLYRTGGGGTEFLTPYADPYNELGLYNELTRILNGGGRTEWP